MGVLVGGGEKSSIQSHLPFYYTQDQGGVHGALSPETSLYFTCSRLGKHSDKEKKGWKSQVMGQLATK